MLLIIFNVGLTYPQFFKDSVFLTLLL